LCRSSTTAQLLNRMLECMADVAAWMRFNWLQLNTAKTEVIWCSSTRRQHQIPQLSAVQLDRLQSVLNAAARLIYQHRKFSHVTPLLKELHWLRVPDRIAFRLAVLAYRCQHNMAPRYLAAQLQQASNVGYRQRLCSSLSAMLDVPRAEHVTIGGCAFSSTAAHVWNSLPTAVQSSESLDIFRRRLKTKLFKRSYN